MLDIRYIREHAETVRGAARNKKVNIDVDHLLKLDATRRKVQQELDEWKQKRNEHARTLKKGATARSIAAARKEGKRLKDAIEKLEHRFAKIETEFKARVKSVPNIPSPDTPIGADESANRVLREVGKKPQFRFPPKEHWQLGEALGVIDNERAAKVSGSRFTYLMGDLALLQFGLLQHALTLLTDERALRRIVQRARLELPARPFIPVIPPVLIRPEVFDRMARLEPRDDRYYIPSDDLWLVGSAEHTLGPLHLEETLREEDLPRRYVGFSSAFRREAGSYGKDLRGILRLHQFDKLEMESFATPEQGLHEQEFFVAIQEHLMQSLGIPYRVVLLCTGEMGAPDVRQVDIEAWFPGQHRYRETHTADYLADYQARRLRTQVRRASGVKELVHMNDATVFAIGRTLAALLENFQQADGSVQVPKPLRASLGGRDRLVPPRSA